jgi:hypothetical protein
MDEEMEYFNQVNKEAIEEFRISEDSYDYELHHLTELSIRPTLEVIFSDELREMGFTLSQTGRTRIVQNARTIVSDYFNQLGALRHACETLLNHLSSWNETLANNLRHRINAFNNLPTADLNRRLLYANEQVAIYQVWQIGIKFILHLRCKKFVIFSTLINWLNKSLEE